MSDPNVEQHSLRNGHSDTSRYREGAFISPEGEYVPVDLHILVILREPERFGLSMPEVEEIHQRFGESLWTEGSSREEIIRLVVNKGWIRIRHYGNKGFTVNVRELDEWTRTRLRIWASSLSVRDGAIDFDRYTQVKIDMPQGYQMTTVEALGVGLKGIS